MDTHNALLDAQEVLRDIGKQYKLAKSVENLALKLERQYANLIDMKEGRRFCAMERCTEIAPAHQDCCIRHESRM